MFSGPGCRKPIVMTLNTAKIVLANMDWIYAFVQDEDPVSLIEDPAPPPEKDA